MKNFIKELRVGLRMFGILVVLLGIINPLIKDLDPTTILIVGATAIILSFISLEQ